MRYVVSGVPVGSEKVPHAAPEMRRFCRQMRNGEPKSAYGGCPRVYRRPRRPAVCRPLGSKSSAVERA